MPIDNVPAFTANPGAFIIGNPVVLTNIAQSMPGGGIPAVNNLQCLFTLNTNTVLGVPGINDFPNLRMLPPGTPPGLVALPPPGGFTSTFSAYYCNAGHGGPGGAGLQNLPYCDIPIAPMGPANPAFLFTVGMNGCTLVIASGVPAGMPPLAPGNWRVLHDWDHNSLANWQAAGFTIHFASYADAAEPGPLPAAWAAVPPIINIYNPNNYPWNYPGMLIPAGNMRVVNNFLNWNGANWQFNSRHYHISGAVGGSIPHDVDAIPVGGATSTQSIII